MKSIRPAPLGGCANSLPGSTPHALPSVAMIWQAAMHDDAVLGRDFKTASLQSKYYNGYYSGTLQK